MTILGVSSLKYTWRIKKNYWCKTDSSLGPQGLYMTSPSQMLIINEWSGYHGFPWLLASPYLSLWWSFLSLFSDTVTGLMMDTRLRPFHRWLLANLNQGPIDGCISCNDWSNTRGEWFLAIRPCTWTLTCWKVGLLHSAGTNCGQGSIVAFFNGPIPALIIYLALVQFTAEPNSSLRVSTYSYMDMCISILVWYIQMDN